MLTRCSADTTPKLYRGLKQNNFKNLAKKNWYNLKLPSAADNLEAKTPVVS